MTTEDMIPVDDFCLHHHIEFSFIRSLRESGLVEFTGAEEKLCVPESQLPHLEKLVRMYYEMDINLEGIETITHLLQRMNDMHQQIVLLKNRLRLYENE